MDMEVQEKPKRKPVPARVPVRNPMGVKTMKDVRNAAVKKHGLYCDPSKWQLDKRTVLARSLTAIRAGLVDLFPAPGPDRAAMLLIDRVTFKQVKLAIYEVGDMAATAEVFIPRHETPGKGGGGHGNFVGNFQKYLQLSNSFREDLRLLIQLAQRQSPTPGDPDLKEYLEALKKAAKAQVVNIERE